MEFPLSITIGWNPKRYAQLYTSSSTIRFDEFENRFQSISLTIIPQPGIYLLADQLLSI